MFRWILERTRQQARTTTWPTGPAPQMPDLYAGAPVLNGDEECMRCTRECVAVCPTEALTFSGGRRLDLGRCLFCRRCESVCPNDLKLFSDEWRMATGQRESLIVTSAMPFVPRALHETAARLFERSFNLMRISCGGCGACESEVNELRTTALELERFGIKFVNSPRHADGLLITGPLTGNMREVLLNTWAALPPPRVVIVCGACAISGGVFEDHDEIVFEGVEKIMPIHLYIPGCPPHPLTILDGILRLLGYIREDTLRP